MIQSLNFIVARVPYVCIRIFCAGQLHSTGSRCAVSVPCDPTYGRVARDRTRAYHFFDRSSAYVVVRHKLIDSLVANVLLNSDANM